MDTFLGYLSQKIKSNTLKISMADVIAQSESGAYS